VRLSIGSSGQTILQSSDAASSWSTAAGILNKLIAEIAANPHPKKAQLQ